MRGSHPVREKSTAKATGWKPPQATCTGQKPNLPERSKDNEPWATSLSDRMLCAKTFPGGTSIILVVCYSVKLNLWAKLIHVKLNPWDVAKIIQIKASFNIKHTSSCHLLLSILLFCKVKNTCCETTLEVRRKGTPSYSLFTSSSSTKYFCNTVFVSTSSIHTLKKLLIFYLS